MENNQIIDDIGNEDSKLFVTREGRELLFQAANWSLFFVVIGFIILAFYALMAFTLFGVGAAMPDGAAGATQMKTVMPIMGCVLLAITTIFIIPFIKLLRFANKAKKAARQQDSDQLTIAIRHLKEHYKWFGLLFIISIVLTIVGSIIFTTTVQNPY